MRGRKNMIIQIDSLEAYSDFISEIANDSEYSDPHFSYDKNSLYHAFQKNNHLVYASVNGEMINGLFVWLVIEDEQYAEMIIGLTKDSSAMADMLGFMETVYPGYQADFVINPKHPVMRNALKSKNASFESEQQRMIHNGIIPALPKVCIEEYSSKWKDAYCLMHRQETYWTAERVIAAEDRFRIFLAVENQRLIGYLDVTYCFAENEPYDLYVEPEMSNKGYEFALLANALARNKPNRMMVLVDIDSSDEIRFYQDAGFERLEGQNSVYASYTF